MHSSKCQIFPTTFHLFVGTEIYLEDINHKFHENRMVDTLQGSVLIVDVSNS